jgi:hypothetical protein
MILFGPGVKVVINTYERNGARLIINNCLRLYDIIYIKCVILYVCYNYTTCALYNTIGGGNIFGKPE